MKTYAIRMYVSSNELLDVILNDLYKKKILKNFYDIDYKSEPPFVIIKTNITIKKLENILSRKYKNLFKMELL